MFPPQFDYRRATTLAEAVELLAPDGDRDAAVVAGGQGLLPEMKAGEASPDVLVDIGDLEGLRSIEVGADVDGTSDEPIVDPDAVGSEHVSVGALSTHADLASSDVLEAVAPVIADTAPEVADVQIRNRGTIGGNLAEADPGADLPAAMVAADATIHAKGGSGTRSIPAESFFGDGEGTALAADEVLTAITAPPAPGTGAYAKKTHSATGYAMVGVAARVAVNDDGLEAVRLAVTGATERPVRLHAAEDALEGTAVDDADGIAEAASRADADLADAPGYGDARASSAFRRRLVPTYVERAIERALERDRSGRTRADPDDDGETGGGETR